MVLTEDICKGALNGAGVPNYDGIAHFLPWYNNDSTIKDADIDKAKDFLKKGGWKDTDGDGIVEKMVRKHHLTYTTHQMHRKDKQLQ